MHHVALEMLPLYAKFSKFETPAVSRRCCKRIPLISSINDAAEVRSSSFIVKQFYSSGVMKRADGRENFALCDVSLTSFLQETLPSIELFEETMDPPSVSAGHDDGIDSILLSTLEAFPTASLMLIPEEINDDDAILLCPILAIGDDSAVGELQQQKEYRVSILNDFWQIDDDFFTRSYNLEHRPFEESQDSFIANHFIHWCPQESTSGEVHRLIRTDYLLLEAEMYTEEDSNGSIIQRFRRLNDMPLIYHPMPQCKNEQLLHTIDDQLDESHDTQQNYSNDAVLEEFQSLKKAIISLLPYQRNCCRYSGKNDADVLLVFDYDDEYTSKALKQKQIQRLLQSARSSIVSSEASLMLIPKTNVIPSIILGHCSELFIDISSPWALMPYDDSSNPFFTRNQREVVKTLLEYDIHYFRDALLPSQKPKDHSFVDILNNADGEEYLLAFSNVHDMKVDCSDGFQISFQHVFNMLHSNPRADNIPQKMNKQNTTLHHEDIQTATRVENNELVKFKVSSEIETPKLPTLQEKRDSSQNNCLQSTEIQTVSNVMHKESVQARTEQAKTESTKQDEVVRVESTTPCVINKETEPTAPNQVAKVTVSLNTNFHTIQRNLRNDFQDFNANVPSNGFDIPRFDNEWCSTSLGVEDMVDSYLQLHGKSSSAKFPNFSVTSSLQLPVKIGNVEHESIGYRSRIDHSTQVNQCDPIKKGNPVAENDLPNQLMQRLRSLRCEESKDSRIRIFISERFLERFPCTIGNLRSDFCISCSDYTLEEPVDLIINPLTAVSVMRLDDAEDSKVLKRNLIRSLTQIAFKFSSIIFIAVHSGSHASRCNDLVMTLSQLSAKYPATLIIRECIHPIQSLSSLIAVFCKKFYRNKDVEYKCIMQRFLKSTGEVEEERRNEARFMQKFPTINYFVAAILLRGYTLHQIALSSTVELLRYLNAEGLSGEKVEIMIQRFIQLLRVHIGLEMRV